MSNPVATIGNIILVPNVPSLVRNVFSLIDFSSQDFFFYTPGEYATFTPSGEGDLFFMIWPLDDALASTKPSFITTNSWNEVDKNSPSVFVSKAWNSVMPKTIIPSAILVDNGIDSSGSVTSKRWARTQPPAPMYNLFNWKIETVNGAPVAAKDYDKYSGISCYPGMNYVVSKKQTVMADNNVTVWTLENPVNPPPRPPGEWAPSILVVGGAFIMMFNVTPQTPAAMSDGVHDNSWSVKFEFGECQLTFNSSGGLDVKITGLGSTKDIQKANLVKGKSAQFSPQSSTLNEDHYIMLVYPVWNGVVVASGISDATASLFTTSQYCYKNRKASIKGTPSGWFDPLAPANVVVDTTYDGDNVMVDFGAKMTMTVTDCDLEFAYQPVFFSPVGNFDQFFIVNDDNPGNVNYTFNVYSIYTLNNTAYTVTEALTVGPAATPPNTHYMKDAWSIVEPTVPPFFGRFAPQIFGSVLKTKETRTFPVKHGNGNFDLLWSGGTPGDVPPTGNWQDYIQSISVTVNQDGSSGSITVDKYGCAGQDAVAAQCIGAVTIDAAGGFGTVAGRIFQGIGMGIADNLTSDGATWNIPLVGLERKMDDMALINVPFFDGKTLDDAVAYLANYAGLFADWTTYATGATTTILGISEDLNVPRFDWKSGTTVRTALEQVMNETGYRYAVFNGTLYVISVDGSGMPTNPGPDRNPGGTLYPNTKIVTIDRQPDFENMRNEIVATAIAGVSDGQNTNFDQVPILPLISAVSQNTIPDIPWAKSIVEQEPGMMSQAQLDALVIRRQKLWMTYVIAGKTTIPGNADIQPFDQWNGYYVGGVTHNLDFQNKSWTTDLELFWHG